MPWDEDRWDRASHAWTRAVLRARHALAPLRRGTFRVVGGNGDALAFVRGGVGEAGPVLVAVNAGEAGAWVAFDAPELAGTLLEDVDLARYAGQDPVATVAHDGSGTVRVPARAGRILHAG
jgi:hypothetical protein